MGGQGEPHDAGDAVPLIARRTRADFENYQTRARRDLEAERRYAATALVAELLPVLDNLERALESATGVLEQGGVFGIYPEGTRTRDGYLHRGHTGVARLALRTGAPIVPVGMTGTDEINPIDRKLPRLFRTVRIQFGTPITADRYAGREHDKLVLRQITDEVMFEVQQLSGYEYVDTYATKKAEDVPVEPVPLATLEAARPAAVA